MKKRTQKGFTIVELVIVIAVIAILAAVLIPTFAGLIAKANLSNDQQMVAMMNKALAVEFPTGAPTLAGDAINGLYANGFSGDKLHTYSEGFHYAYDASQNKMYLLNAENQPIYPDDKAELTNLWGLYGDNKNDYVDGVNQYVATAMIANKVDFDAVFVSGSYTIDLNKGVMIVDATNKANIKLINGSTTVAGYAEGSDATMMEQVAVTGSGDTYVLQSTEALLVENQIIVNPEGGKFVHVGAPEITIKNCVISATQLVVDGDYSNKNISKVIIEDCTFVGAPSNYFGLVLQYMTECDDVEVIIRNNTFINCDRAIHITGNKNLNTTIEGNVFNLLKNNEKNVAAQVTKGTDCSITFRGNTMSSGDAFIRVYKGSEEFFTADALTFTGNNIADGIQKVFSDGEENGAYKDLLTAVEAKIN